MPATAFLLPGQGAQAVGMGKAFYDGFPAAREVYKAANSRLSFDVAALCFEGPQEELTKTEKCQPALFVTSLAAVAALRAQAPSFQPLAAAGLSLGEVTALTVAEAVAFDEALYLVQARAEAMAECTARQRGAMLAVIGATPEGLEGLCRASGAWPANYNTLEQVVLSGTAEAIAKAEQLAKAHGAKRAIRLEVAGAFHCELMRPAAEALKPYVAKVRFTSPRIPVISNVTGQPYAATDDPGVMLVRQITSPVQWEPSMRYLIGQGMTHTVEFPPARVLTGMMRKINPAVTALAVDEPKDFEQLPA
jgi:[acyl-carrier-protein] S-malonyltransferase